jgi:P-type Na+/K+ transporter
MLAIVVTNVAIGFFQEYRAECAMESLQKLCSPIAKVIRQQRNGVQTVSIPTSSVTVGDIVELRTGQVVPADIRLFSTLNLQIDESLLTGESLTALKGSEMLSRYESDDTPIGDCFNIAYSGTIVMKGEGRGIVYATGMETEIGKIGRTLQKNQAKIPPTQRPTFRERFQVVAQKILGLYNTSPLQKKYPHII